MAIEIYAFLLYIHSSLLGHWFRQFHGGYIDSKSIASTLHVHETLKPILCDKSYRNWVHLEWNSCIQKIGNTLRNCEYSNTKTLMFN